MPPRHPADTPAGDLAPLHTPDQRELTDHPYRDDHWHHHLDIPTPYLNLRPYRLKLPTPLPRRLLDHALNAHHEFHTHHCLSCRALRTIDLLARPLHRRALLVLTTTLAAYLALRATDSLPTTLPFPITGTLTALTLVHAALALAVLAAAAHRRHLPRELAVRFHQAHEALRPPTPPEPASPN